MSELEENMSVVVLWIRCTFIVLGIYAGALVISGFQVLKQGLAMKSSAARARDASSAPAQGKLPGSA